MVTIWIPKSFAKLYCITLCDVTSSVQKRGDHEPGKVESHCLVQLPPPSLLIAVLHFLGKTVHGFPQAPPSDVSDRTIGRFVSVHWSIKWDFYWLTWLSLLHFLCARRPFHTLSILACWVTDTQCIHINTHAVFMFYIMIAYVLWIKYAYIVPILLCLYSS